MSIFTTKTGAQKYADWYRERGRKAIIRKTKPGRYMVYIYKR